MNFWKNTRKKLSRNLRFTIEDPISFKEIWSVNSTGMRMLSLLLSIIILFSLLILFLFSGVFTDWKGEGNVSIERKKLEEQGERIERLTAKLASQEQYIKNVRRILSGEVPPSTDFDSLNFVEEIDSDSLSDVQNKDEQQLAQKVKEDINTSTQTKKRRVNYFAAPVTGTISQEYTVKQHVGIDIVTEPDAVVKSCLSGTVIYSGFTRKDGYIVLIDHGNDFISVYKHNRAVLKQIGVKVKLGDPIAIVGNTGENTDGPHLHFELWFKGLPVNPKDYVRFKK